MSKQIVVFDGMRKECIDSRRSMIVHYVLLYAAAESSQGRCNLSLFEIVRGTKDYDSQPWL